AISQSNELRVSVVEFADRRHYQMQWRDPVSGRKKTKSTGVERTGRKKDRDAAQKVAGEFEAELREGRYKPASKVTWAEFRERYELEVLQGLADNTDLKVATVFNSVEQILNPQLLSGITTDRLSHYQSELRQGGRAEDTIKGHLAHLLAALRWAKDVGLLNQLPEIAMPKRAKKAKVMKGRPITTEEFERMLAKVSFALFEWPKLHPKHKRKNTGNS
ncbi:unnamed protein product, partial [marine sediment metagenome]